MYNLIKMDLYRFWHATSTKVLLLVVSCFSIFTVVMTSMDLQSMRENPEEMAETLEEDELGTVIDGNTISMNFGIYSETKTEWVTEEIVFAQLLETQIASGIFLVILTVFVASFVNGERKHGFIKNIAGQLKKRWYLVISKLVTVAVLNAVMFPVLAVVMYIAGKVMFEEQLVMGSFCEVLKVLGGQYMLHLGFASLILAMTVILNGSDISITLGILLSCRVMTLLYVPISRLKLLGNKTIDLAKYAIEMNVTGFSCSAKSEGIIRSMVVAVIFVVIPCVLASMVIQKRDVR